MTSEVKTQLAAQGLSNGPTSIDHCIQTPVTRIVLNFQPAQSLYVIWDADRRPKAQTAVLRGPYLSLTDASGRVALCSSRPGLLPGTWGARVEAQYAEPFWLQVSAAQSNLSYHQWFVFLALLSFPHLTTRRSCFFGLSSWPWNQKSHSELEMWSISVHWHTGGPDCNPWISWEILGNPPPQT